MNRRSRFALFVRRHIALLTIFTLVLPALPQPSGAISFSQFSPSGMNNLALMQEVQILAQSNALATALSRTMHACQQFSGHFGEYTYSIATELGTATEASKKLFIPGQPMQHAQSKSMQVNPHATVQEHSSATGSSTFKALLDSTQQAFNRCQQATQDFEAIRTEVVSSLNNMWIQLDTNSQFESQNFLPTLRLAALQFGHRISLATGGSLRSNLWRLQDDAQCEGDLIADNLITQYLLEVFRPQPQAADAAVERTELIELLRSIQQQLMCLSAEQIRLLDLAVAAAVEWGDEELREKHNMSVAALQWRSGVLNLMLLIEDAASPLGPGYTYDWLQREMSASLIDEATSMLPNQRIGLYDNETGSLTFFRTCNDVPTTAEHNIFTPGEYNAQQFMVQKKTYGQTSATSPHDEATSLYGVPLSVTSTEICQATIPWWRTANGTPSGCLYPMRALEHVIAPQHKGNGECSTLDMLRNYGVCGHMCPHKRWELMGLGGKGEQAHEDISDALPSNQAAASSCNIPVREGFFQCLDSAKGAAPQGTGFGVVTEGCSGATLFGGAAPIDDDSGTTTSGTDDPDATDPDEVDDTETDDDDERCGSADNPCDFDDQNINGSSTTQRTDQQQQRQGDRTTRTQQQGGDRNTRGGNSSSGSSNRGQPDRHGHNFGDDHQHTRITSQNTRGSNVRGQNQHSTRQNQHHAGGPTGSHTPQTHNRHAPSSPTSVHGKTIPTDRSTEAYFKYWLMRARAELDKTLKKTKNKFPSDPHDPRLSGLVTALTKLGQAQVIKDLERDTRGFVATVVKQPAVVNAFQVAYKKLDPERVYLSPGTVGSILTYHAQQMDPARNYWAYTSPESEHDDSHGHGDHGPHYISVLAQYNKRSKGIFGGLWPAVVKAMIQTPSFTFKQAYKKGDQYKKEPFKTFKKRFTQFYTKSVAHEVIGHAALHDITDYQDAGDDHQFITNVVDMIRNPKKNLRNQSKPRKSSGWLYSALKSVAQQAGIALPGQGAHLDTPGLQSCDPSSSACGECNPWTQQAMASAGCLTASGSALDGSHTGGWASTPVDPQLSLGCFSGDDAGSTCAPQTCTEPMIWDTDSCSCKKQDLGIEDVAGPSGQGCKATVCPDGSSAVLQGSSCVCSGSQFSTESHVPFRAAPTLQRQQHRSTPSRDLRRHKRLRLR